MSISQSFAALKEVLGFGEEAKNRIFPLEGEPLTEAKKHAKNNIVTTSKYHWLTFLPVNLFQQFSKAANVYFAMITVMQTIKVISISNGDATMLPPLVLVVFTSMCKDAYEDYVRHGEDSLENDAIATRFNRKTKNFEKVAWKQIEIGDFIKVDQDGFFPADMVCVKSTEDEGVCYVETKNLDGETNLKNKEVPKDLRNSFDHPEQNITHFEATFNIDGPNNLIYKFDGRMEAKRQGAMLMTSAAEQEQIIPLGNDNILLRGMSLRNTEYVIGVVVYTGHETKIQMNTTKSDYKVSKMMRLTNLAIVYIFVMQVIFSCAGAVYCAYWQDDNYENPYLALHLSQHAKQDLGFVIITMTGSWILIFCNFVPISLLVTLEMVKFWQGSFMDADIDMYDADQDFAMRAQSTNINEELGQIEYIFSDKTGTLTCNIMEFKKFSTQTAAFDVTPLKKGGVRFEVNDKPVDFNDNPDGLVFKDLQDIQTSIKDTYSADYKSLDDVLLHLSVCHTVVIDKIKGVYNAASPDEQALVEGAKEQGYEFIGREPGNVCVIRDAAGYEKRFEILNVLEFNSTRKRMSVIFKNMQTGYIQLYSKGADSIMEKLLKQGDAAHTQFLEQTKSYIDEFSREGLRTLMLTKKDISQREYDAWNIKFQEACQSLENRDDKIMDASAEIELDMTLVGSTAIEDRLQDDVEDTIISLKAAGIKFWVLTGDKIETAIQIGYSTGLLDNEIAQHIVDGTTFRTISHQLVACADAMHDQQPGQRNAMVLSGESLHIIYTNKGLMQLMLHSTDDMEVVVGCRVSPKQKGDIVALMRNRHQGKCTLAIGDGANDCSMISKAHVGIGIAGREGMQAARSSDFAIGKFKHLHKLLFVHGREAYRRNGQLILYMFYKNVLYVMVQFIFGYWSVFSGQTMYEKWIYQVYNVTFTGLHNIWYALFDREFTAYEFLTTPLYYSIGMKNTVFNMKEFWIWFMYANAQAAMIIGVSFWTSQVSAVDDGKTFTFWAGGHHVYMNCVLLANIIILKMQNEFTGYNIFIVFCQISSYFVLLYYFQHELQTDVIYMFWEEFTGSWTAWLGCFFCVASLWTIDSMLSALRLSVAWMTASGDKSTSQILEEQEFKMGIGGTTMLKQATQLHLQKDSMQPSNKH